MGDPAPEQAQRHRAGRCRCEKKRVRARLAGLRKPATSRGAAAPTGFLGLGWRLGRPFRGFSARGPVHNGTASSERICSCRQGLEGGVVETMRASALLAAKIQGLVGIGEPPAPESSAFGLVYWRHTTS